jgi:hypothetical protein
VALAQIRPTGLNTDIPAYDVPPELWTRAENMSFQDVHIEQTRGWRYIYDANPTVATPLYVQNSLHGGVNHWLYGCASAVGVTDAAGTHHNLTPASDAPSSTDAADWSGCELNGYPVINWGAIPHSWDRSTGSNVAPLAEWPSGYTARVMRAHRFSLWALNIGGGVDWPSVVMWSDTAAPGNLPAAIGGGGGGSGTAWTAGSSSNAGSLSLGDTGNAITDGLTLGDNFIVYKAGSSYVVFPDETLIYGQRQLLRTMGCLAPNCVAEWQGLHAVLGDGDIFLTDGTSAGTRSLIDRATRRTLFAELAQGEDPANNQPIYERSFVVVSPNSKEVLFCYPTEGSLYPNKALVWDASSGTTRFKDTVDVFGANSFRSLRLGGSGTPSIAYGNLTISGVSDTWSTQTDTWATVDRTWDENAAREASDGLVAIDFDNATLAEFDINDSQEVGQINATVARESLDFGAPDQVKLLTEVWPKVIGSTGDVIQVRAGGQMEPGDPISWSPYVNYTIGTDRKVDTFATGRLISVEFLGQGIRGWRVGGFDANVELAGRY